MKRILFTADLHLGDEYILKYQENELFSNINEHDEWILDLWKRNVRNGDDVYLLGDLGSDNKDLKRIFGRLPGRKYLIIGNHDHSVNDLSGLFYQICQIHNIHIKTSSYNGISDRVMLSLCHYPLLSWKNKPQGAIMLHGHCHGKMDEYNNMSKDLRFDVGVNSELAKRCGGFVDMGTIYKSAIEKAGGMNLMEYAENIYEDFEK